MDTYILLGDLLGDLLYIYIFISGLLLSYLPQVGVSCSAQSMFCSIMTIETTHKRNNERRAEQNDNPTNKKMKTDGAKTIVDKTLL